MGAALESADGAVFSGCNVENASYGLTICAERAAICAAVSAGVTRFRRAVVVSDVDPPAALWGLPSGPGGIRSGPPDRRGRLAEDDALAAFRSAAGGVRPGAASVKWWLGGLLAVITIAGCQEELTAPADCPALCPGGQPEVFDEFPRRQRGGQQLRRIRPAVPGPGNAGLQRPSRLRGPRAGAVPGPRAHGHGAGHGAHLHYRLSSAEL